MNKTKIEWCDYTWNPVTGCLHGCKYCYARRIANRFGGNLIYWRSNEEGLYELDKPVYNEVDEDRMIAFPYKFQPTFHKYRLEQPKEIRKASKIFVSSMGDLFGGWVPDEWIKSVLNVVKECPQHTFLFLTQNPTKYYYFEFPENAWVGASIVDKPVAHCISNIMGFFNRSFLSLEPLLNDIAEDIDFNGIDWVIVGSQTGPGAIKPKPEWVQNIIDKCRALKIPVFLKDNLNWPEKIQEWPFQEGLL